MTSPWGDRNEPVPPEPSEGTGGGTSRNFIFWAIAGLLIVLVLFWISTDKIFGDTPTDNTLPHLLKLTIIVLAVGFCVFFVRRPGLRKSLLYISIWLGIGFVLFVGYAFRDEFSRLGDRLLAEIRPGMAVSTGDGILTIRRADDGHFYVASRINGASIRLLVDTGATSVVLTKSDARKMGIDPARLNYSIATSTANGVAMNAPIKIQEISIGPLKLKNIKALVAGGRLHQSLLGVNFLNRLAGYQVEGNTLKLIW